MNTKHNEFSFVIVMLYTIQTFGSPITAPSTSSSSQAQTSQSQNSILQCISRDRRWNNPCGVTRFRRSINGDLRTKIEGIQHYINDTVKHYIAGEYFHTSWLVDHLESHPLNVFTHNFESSSHEVLMERNLYTIIANVDVLSNCGTGALADIHLVTLLDELNTRIYSALCTIDMSNGHRDVIPTAESMVAQKVLDYTTVENGLSQAMNIYQIVGNIETVIRNGM